MLRPRPIEFEIIQNFIKMLSPEARLSEVKIKKAFVFEFKCWSIDNVISYERFIKGVFNEPDIQRLMKDKLFADH